MAEENEDQGVEAAEAGKLVSGAKKQLIIFIVLGVLVLAASIGGTLFFLGFFDSTETEEEVSTQEMAETGDVAVVNKTKPAMYFPIKPAFVISFPGRGRQRFLQAEVTVLTRDVEVFNTLQVHSPLIKNRLVMLFSGEVYEELQTDEGKELLRLKTLEALQQVVEEELGKPGVEEILFTNFVMQ
jgi:flagellar FliL protein